jgi:hypothetical protein
MPRAVSPSPRALRLAFVASLALFARVLDAARADKQSNETLDPLAGLRAHPELPRELRLPLSVASAALADAGLAPRAADAIARYGGADRAARDLTLVLAAATAACGDGREEATDALASSSAAAARAGPLRALFSGLTHELELRTRVTKELDELSASRLLSAEESYDVRVDERGRGARFVVDALDEAEASLARAGGDGGSASCFAGAGGIVTRTLRALGILALDLEAVVTTLRQRSAEELRECGLGASALDAKENDSDDSDDDDDSETAADVETLAYFAARAETCRRRGRVERSADLATFASVKTISEMPEEGKKDRLRRLSARVLASHLALADATRAEARAAEIRGDGYAKGLLRTCLGDSFPPPDPRWDAPAGASLLTSTGALAFVVAALGDVTLSESACQRALDSPPGVFFASPALDAVAQEAAEAGVFPAAAAWLAASPSGSAGLEASVDEVQAAARACAINAAEKKTANEKKSWIVVERGPTDAALSFLRRLEAATLGRRGGRRGYSAVGKLVRALETLVEKLESGGCIDQTSEIASVEPVEPSKRAEEPGSVKGETKRIRRHGGSREDDVARRGGFRASRRRRRRRRGPRRPSRVPPRFEPRRLVLDHLRPRPGRALRCRRVRAGRRRRRRGGVAARRARCGAQAARLGVIPARRLRLRLRRRRPPRLGPLVPAGRRRRGVRAALLPTPRGGLRGRLASGRGPRSRRVSARGEVARGAGVAAGVHAALWAVRVAVFRARLAQAESLHLGAGRREGAAAPAPREEAHHARGGRVTKRVLSSCRLAKESRRSLNACLKRNTCSPTPRTSSSSYLGARPLVFLRAQPLEPLGVALGYPPLRHLPLPLGQLSPVGDAG